MLLVQALSASCRHWPRLNFAEALQGDLKSASGFVFVSVRVILWFSVVDILHEGGFHAPQF